MFICNMIITNKFKSIVKYAVQVAISLSRRVVICKTVQRTKNIHNKTPSGRPNIVFYTKIRPKLCCLLSYESNIMLHSNNIF